MCYIYNYENCIDYISKHNEKCYLVTSDGGFDFSDDYSNQEQYAVRLILSEILTGSFET